MFCWGKRNTVEQSIRHPPHVPRLRSSPVKSSSCNRSDHRDLAASQNMELGQYFPSLYPQHARIVTNSSIVVCGVKWTPMTQTRIQRTILQMQISTSNGNSSQREDSAIILQGLATEPPFAHRRLESKGSFRRTPW